MNPPSFELTWLDAREAVSVSELSLACGMSGDELAELVDYGALIPLGPNRTEHLFSAECVPQLRTVGKLRLDFDLDVFTVALLMGYLTRIETLEQHVRLLRANLPGHVAAARTEDSGLRP